MSGTVSDLLTLLRSEVTSEEGLSILDRLEIELKLRLWPEQVFEAALRVFGPSIQNPASRSRKSLDRRIGHCMENWNLRYGPLTLAQERYAASILCAAIDAGALDHQAVKPTDKAAVPMPFVLARMAKLINHETVHAGFKRRADEVASTPLAAVLGNVA